MLVWWSIIVIICRLIAEAWRGACNVAEYEALHGKYKK